MIAKQYPALRRSEATEARNAANSFYRIAREFFQKLPPDMDASARYCYEHRSDLVAAVTNFALAIELYFKALAMATGSKVQKTHDLLVLFESLHSNVRDSVELRYKEHLKTLPPNAAVAINVYITTAPVPPTADQKEKAGKGGPPDDSIRSVLKSEKNAFSSWRYFHETGVADGVGFLRVDFGRLLMVTNAIQDHFEGPGFALPKSTRS